MVQGVRSVVRTILRRPGFSAVVVLTLALGIGANSAVFTVLNSVLFRPLPYQAPDELVRVLKVRPDRTDPITYLGGLDILDYRAQTDVLAEVSAFYTYREMGADITVDGRPERIRVLRSDAAYFRVFGIGPLLGRGFTREEERSDARLAVLSEGLWERMFDRDPDVPGRTIELNGSAFEVIGVMPRGFRNPLGGAPDAWIPQDLQPGGSNNRGNNYLTGIARLADGVTLAQAQERLNAAMDGVREQDADAVWNPLLVPLHQDTVGRATTTLWVLTGAVVLLLLAACVNVAALFLARSVSRSRELAIRSALGGGRSAIVRTLLSESTGLALLGGFAGLALAVAGTRALVAAAPEAIPRLDEVGVDWRVAAFTLAVALGTGLFFGLLPALRSGRADLSRSLRDGDRATTGGRRTRRIQGALVVAEVALAVVLLVGAGVLFRSFEALRAVDLVVDPERLLTYEVHLPGSTYPEALDRQAFYDEFLPRVEGLPGVTAVGGISWLPIQGRYHDWGVRRGDAPDVDESWMGADMRITEGRVFEALGIPLVAGRGFRASDRMDAPLVAVVNQVVADRLFPDEDPVGGTVRAGGRTWEIVGVAAAVPYDAEGNVAPTVYLPHTQFGDNRNWAVIQTVRADGPLSDLVSRLRAELLEVDPNLVLYRIRPMEDLVAGQRAQEQFALTLMWVFAVLAGMLSAIGIYGILSYMVSQRSHEVGVRMALGAGRSDIRRLVVGRGLRLGAAGLAAGLLGGWWALAALRSLVFEVEVRDPWVMGTVALGVLALVWLAALIPASRAAAVEPSRAFESG